MTLALVLALGAVLARRVLASPPLAALVLAPLFAVARDSGRRAGLAERRLAAGRLRRRAGRRPRARRGRGSAVVVVDAGPDPAAIDDCLDDLGVDHVAAC